MNARYPDTFAEDCQEWIRHTERLHHCCITIDLPFIFKGTKWNIAETLQYLAIQYVDIT